MFEIIIRFKKCRLTKLLPFLLFLLIMLLLSSTINASVIRPIAPKGLNEGYIDFSYTFSTNSDIKASYCMFNWDDGSFSPWIKIDSIDREVSTSHSWDSEGTYNVRVKFRYNNLDETLWSDNLIINISEPVDTDNDGFFDLEDTDDDNDGILDKNDPFPKNNSEWSDSDSDGIGDNLDQDDDNDGLEDNIEIKIGSDHTFSEDVEIISIKGKNHFLIDTNKDGRYNKFYNTNSKINTKLRYEKNGIYLIDYNKDGDYDYTYDGDIHKFKESNMSWIMIIASIIIISLLIIFILIKTGILFIYEEEYEIEE